MAARHVRRWFHGVDIETRNLPCVRQLVAHSDPPVADPLVNPNTPQAGYRMRYRDDDVQVGVFSDILTVTVGSRLEHPSSSPARAVPACEGPLDRESPT